MQGDRANVETIRLTIPSRLELLPLVDQLAEGISERMDFSEEERSNISISVMEAGTNAIQHGNRVDPKKPVDLRFDIHPDRLEVEVSDLGPGFDLDHIYPELVTTPEHLFDARGRGIFIMRNCMDDVQFLFSDAGTTVRLVKARRAASNGSQGAA